MAGGAQVHGPSAVIADLKALLDLGNDLSDAGDEPGAEPYFRAAAERGSADGWFNLGNSLLRQGRPAEAVTAYLHATAAGADDVSAERRPGLRGPEGLAGR